MKSAQGLKFFGDGLIDVAPSQKQNEKCPSTNKYESLIDVDLISSNHSTFIVTTYLHYKYTLIHNSTLILNTHIFVIHQNTKNNDLFYNQNLYFRIQCKKSTNIITIHFHDILIPHMIQLDEIYDYMIYIFSPNALLRSKFKVPFSKLLLKEF